MPKQRFLTDVGAELEAQIPKFCEKWRSIQLLTYPIDHDKVAGIIKTAYNLNGYEEPEIIFYGNPLQAIQAISTIDDARSYLGRNVHIKFLKRVFDHLKHLIERQLDQQLFIRLRNQTLRSLVPYEPEKFNSFPLYFSDTVLKCLESQLVADLEKLNPELEYTDIRYFTRCLSRPAEWASWACLFDFCASVLQLSHDKKKWQLLQELICETGFLFQYERVCIACERPSILLFDQDNFLHAERQPALKFADGYGVYACHGRFPFSMEEYSE
ncbi:MAG: hypothetical protein F6J95_015275 [Leptolyngbya sp. SIO1E4]|nr:hypothetical protein [Leptolyngbya sp. SIO1E4]